MLFTFSQATYSSAELESYLLGASEQDCLVLWQDGVLLPLKYPNIFNRLTTTCYALENDLQARNLTEFTRSFAKVRSISFTELVTLTERYTPQMAL
ncbi:DsrH/TusB family sulfur relay protein [Caviibacterium pharyngocola]|uniref:Sulfurtransferase complex subunit TusB n=1 Tax=Caviibacterium pharyngocola TaxID=28159 RepID=A0A2M8RWF4_9PAST|nr:DsrH/TusB family sulfur metabolism protein [Caviibacterium pharyngocola]PJG83220.1 hypothetical protein CVP04_04955 [Caviibacterium pharyngocola]